VRELAELLAGGFAAFGVGAKGRCPTGTDAAVRRSRRAEDVAFPVAWFFSSTIE
jgi:hypothetical protein